MDLVAMPDSSGSFISSSNSSEEALPKRRAPKKGRGSNCTHHQLQDLLCKSPTKISSRLEHKRNLWPHTEVACATSTSSSHKQEQPNHDAASLITEGTAWENCPL